MIPTRKLIGFVFFQNEKNLDAPGENQESKREPIRGKYERGTLQIVTYRINSSYGEDKIIR